MSAPVSDEAVNAGLRAFYEARAKNSDRIVACAPNKPGWDKEAWEREHPHVDRDRAFAQAVADTVRAEILEQFLVLHPKAEHPTRGCCAPPKLCNGHPPECRSSEHGWWNPPAWPCATLRALGVES